MKRDFGKYYKIRALKFENTVTEIVKLNYFKINVFKMLTEP